MSESNVMKKVLLIDDTDFHLSIAKNMLKNNYEVATARSGREGLEYLLKGLVPDIILLDIVMPEMDGWETYHKIKGISLLQDVPIVFLTSSTEAEDIKYAHQIGAADYIMKPYEKNDLLKKVDNIIQKFHAKKTDPV